MKAAIKSIEYPGMGSKVPFIIKKNDFDIKMVDYHHNDQYSEISLGYLNLTDDNYRLFVNGQYLTLIVSEVKEAKRPMHLHNIGWNIYRNHNYEVMKSIDLWLPGDNFYLVRHYLVPKDQILKIVLGRTDNY